MTKDTRAKVGLLALIAEWYDRRPEIKSMMVEFADELIGTLSAFVKIDFPGVCSTREQVDQAVAGFEASRQDLIMVLLLTYTPSHTALSALNFTRLPILIFNTQRLYAVTGEMTALDITKNHGMHGVQDMANVLLRVGRKFHLVTGHYKDERTLAEVKSWCDAARLVSFLRHMRIGLLGYPMEGMGDFGLDQTAFLGQVGVRVHHIAMKAVAAQAKIAPGDEIAARMAEDRQRFKFEKDITDKEHEASSRLEWALRQILRNRGLHGFACHFIAVGEEGWMDTLPFLATSKLLAEGYGFGGEGDVTSAVAVAMMQELVDLANFTEMFTMDFADNAVLMAHMGESNWKMARQDEPLWLRRAPQDMVDLRVDPLRLTFSLEPGEATLVSLTTQANGKLKFIVTEGQVVDFPYIAGLSLPHYKFRPDGDLSDVLTLFSMEGASHHQAMAYGRWAVTVEKIAALLGTDCARV